MKKVLQPKQNEEAIYYSDFSGKLFADFVPVTVKIECNYGSKYDGSKVKFHLSDKGLEQLLDFFKERLCEETKNEFKRSLELDCQNSKCLHNNKEIYQRLI